MNKKQLNMLIALSLAASVLLTGCGEDEPVQEVVHRPQPTPTAAPAPPPVTSVSELMEELRIDDRVYMADNRAPATTEARRAVLEFFDAFARGNDQSLMAKLSPLDREVLQTMVASNAWQRAVANITSIEIQTGSSPNGDAVLALFEVGGMDYEPQLWYYRSQDNGFTFEAAPSPPNMMSRLSGTDWIASWHEILEEEDQIAIRPDIPIDLPQRTIEEPSVGGG